MWIRDMKPLGAYPTENKEVMIFPKYQRTNDMLLWADQILCATNKERKTLNNKIRELKGFGPEPEIGDKIINLTNHWDFGSENLVEPLPLTNGSIGTITDIYKDYLYVPAYIYQDREIPVLYTSMTDEDGEKYFGMPADYKFFTENVKTLTKRQEFLMSKNNELPDPPFDITYGYAITCHKAQGSQWDRVLVQESWFPNDRVEHARWLYTAITRSAKRCVIIKK